MLTYGNLSNSRGVYVTFGLCVLPQMGLERKEANRESNHRNANRILFQNLQSPKRQGNSNLLSDSTRKDGIIYVKCLLAFLKRVHFLLNVFYSLYKINKHFGGKPFHFWKLLDFSLSMCPDDRRPHTQFVRLQRFGNTVARLLRNPFIRLFENNLCRKKYY